MRRSKGFILAEILISMMLQAGFVIVLCGAFYLLVSFESDVQMKLVARARGQRVIQYIDQRIRNAGIGLQGGSYKNGKIYYNNSRCVRVTLDPFTREQTPKGKLFQNSGSAPSKYLRLPVALTYKGNDFKASDTSGSLGDTTLSGDATFVGNVLTLFYAQRETDTANFVIVPISYDINTLKYVTIPSIDIAPGETKSFIYIDKTVNNRIKNNSNVDFRISTSTSKEQNLSGWTVLAGVGIPLLIIDEHEHSIEVEDKNNVTYIELKNYIRESNKNEKDNNKTIATVHAGDEMLYLKCERMFSVQDDIEGKSFSFQELGENVWSSTQYYQDNILELHFELDTKNNILDLYVLASGGKNGKTNNPPQNWPSKARWKDEYKYNVMYVSHASWKLDNIPDNFDWFDKN